jgi:hypothetical protein
MLVEMEMREKKLFVGKYNTICMIFNIDDGFRVRGAYMIEKC